MSGGETQWPLSSLVSSYRGAPQTILLLSPADQVINHPNPAGHAVLSRSARAMRRTDRARIIRDTILAMPREQWAWKRLAGYRCLEFAIEDWVASLSTPFSVTREPPVATTYLQALILKHKLDPLPNVLELWVPGQGKVLSVEWDTDDVRLISMRREQWESELFGLPKYEPRGAR